MELDSTVKALISSENDARSLVQNSKLEAEKIISRASSDGELMVKNKISETNKIVKGMLETAESEAGSDSKLIIQKAVLELDDLKKRYSEIRANFVSEFISNFFKSKVDN